MNRCPGLESSNNRNKLNEEVMYNEMMISLVEITLQRQKYLSNITHEHINVENMKEDIFEKQDSIGNNEDLHLNDIEVKVETMEPNAASTPVTTTRTPRTNQQ